MIRRAAYSAQVAAFLVVAGVLLAFDYWRNP